MKKLKIEKIEGYNYSLKDKDDKLYKLNIEFYDLHSQLNINDYIFIDEELLNEQVLNFGPLSGEYGKNINNIDDKELLIIDRGNKRIYLKRYYG